MKPRAALLSIFVMVVFVLGACNASEIATPTSTVTSIETLEVPAFPTPTATHERVIAPTLTSMESEDYVKDLLENNAGCSLPCIWGIAPGTTTYPDAQRLFGSLGWRGSEVQGAYYTGKDIQGFSIVLSVGIYAIDDIVEKMSIQVAGKDFLNKVQYFSFENIFKVFSKPTEILVFIGTNPGVLEPDKTSFELLLYYADRNTLIEYTGTAVRYEGIYRVCPAQPNAESEEVDPLSGDVTIYVGEQGQISNPRALVRPFWNLPGYYISAEKAFGMNMDQFYGIVSRDSESACFESPLSAWER